MASVIKTDQARLDLERIWVYIAERNFDAADRLIQTIDQKLHLLAESPGLGPERPELGPSVRSYPVGNYLLFYHRVEGGIELLRVLHGARDIPGQFHRGG